MFNIVSTTFFLLFLLFVEDRICKKDIRNYQTWQSSSRESPMPKSLSDTKPAKVLSFIIGCGIAIWCFIFILIPVGKYSLSLLYYIFGLEQFIIHYLFGN